MLLKFSGFFKNLLFAAVAKKTYLTKQSAGLTVDYKTLIQKDDHLFPGVPYKQMKVSVILPVKDEAHHLNQTLDALRKQVDEAGLQLAHNTYEVLLLANNCKDASFAVAKAYQQKYPLFQLHIANITLPEKSAHIGTVRRMLMDEAYRRHQFNNRDGIIASTDSDTEVDSNWLHFTIKEISNGIDAVGGRIISKPVNKKIRLYYLRDVAYRCLATRLEAEMVPSLYNPWPNHFQCFGASMAVSCSAYVKAGRLPVVPCLEDEAFCRSLNRIDARVRRSPLVKVYTSARCKGRVDAGFSGHLSNLTNMSRDKALQYVNPPDGLKVKFLNKQRLKQCWNERLTSMPSKSTLKNIAQALCIPYRWLKRSFMSANYFGELWEKIEWKMDASKQWHKQYDYIPVSDAIQQLRARFTA